MFNQYSSIPVNWYQSQSVLGINGGKSDSPAKTMGIYTGIEYGVNHYRKSAESAIGHGSHAGLGNAIRFERRPVTGDDRGGTEFDLYDSRAINLRRSAEWKIEGQRERDEMRDAERRKCGGSSLTFIGAPQSGFVDNHDDGTYYPERWSDTNRDSEAEVQFGRRSEISGESPIRSDFQKPLNWCSPIEVQQLRFHKDSRISMQTSQFPDHPENSPCGGEVSRHCVATSHHGSNAMFHGFGSTQPPFSSSAVEQNLQPSLKRQIEVEDFPFPYFNGKNPRMWVETVNQWFFENSIPQNQRVGWVKPYLEGWATTWFDVVQLIRGPISWVCFTELLVDRFGTYERFGYPLSPVSEFVEARIAAEVEKSKEKGEQSDEMSEADSSTPFSGNILTTPKIMECVQSDKESLSSRNENVDVLDPDNVSSVVLNAESLCIVERIELYFDSDRFSCIETDKCYDPGILEYESNFSDGEMDNSDDSGISVVGVDVRDENHVALKLMNQEVKPVSFDYVRADGRSLKFGVAERFGSKSNEMIFNNRIILGPLMCHDPGIEVDYLRRFSSFKLDVKDWSDITKYCLQQRVQQKNAALLEWFLWGNLIRNNMENPEVVPKSWVKLVTTFERGTRNFIFHLQDLRTSLVLRGRKPSDELQISLRSQVESLRMISACSKFVEPLMCFDPGIMMNSLGCPAGFEILGLNESGARKLSSVLKLLGFGFIRLISMAEYLLCIFFSSYLEHAGYSEAKYLGSKQFLKVDVISSSTKMIPYQVAYKNPSADLEMKIGWNFYFLILHNFLEFLELCSWGKGLDGVCDESISCLKVVESLESFVFDLFVMNKSVEDLGSAITHHHPELEFHPIARSSSTLILNRRDFILPAVYFSSTCHTTVLSSLTRIHGHLNELEVKLHSRKRESSNEFMTTSWSIGVLDLSRCSFKTRPHSQAAAVLVPWAKEEFHETFQSFKLQENGSDAATIPVPRPNKGCLHWDLVISGMEKRYLVNAHDVGAYMVHFEVSKLQLEDKLFLKKGDTSSDFQDCLKNSKHIWGSAIILWEQHSSYRNFGELAILEVLQVVGCRDNESNSQNSKPKGLQTKKLSKEVVAAFVLLMKCSSYYMTTFFISKKCISYLTGAAFVLKEEALFMLVLEIFKGGTIILQMANFQRMVICSLVKSKKLQGSIQKLFTSLEVMLEDDSCGRRSISNKDRIYAWLITFGKKIIVDYGCKMDQGALMLGYEKLGQKLQGINAENAERACCILQVGKMLKSLYVVSDLRTSQFLGEWIVMIQLLGQGHFGNLPRGQRP